MSDISNQWSTIREHVDLLSKRLVEDDLDYKERKTVQKEHTRLQKLLDAHDTMDNITQEIKLVETQLQSSDDAEINQLYQAELKELAQQQTDSKTLLEDLLHPPDELDTCSIFLEIRAGAGGQEAALFAGNLLKMYTNYALSKGWRVDVANTSTTDLGGIKEVIVNIKGKDIYGSLKHESGVHRVQRVPQTEGSGRIHTSTATVAVLPEVETDDISIIDPNDIRIDVFRASGAGGQHVNTTDSAVRITHLPTGVTVSCQDERSQLKNKNKGMKILKARIAMAQREQQQSERSAQRKELVGSGMRAEKVRTYNYPQNRVTDHVAQITLNKLDIVMQGNLDEIIYAHLESARQKRLSQPIKIG
jgi:peptide chain release factor 1